MYNRELPRTLSLPLPRNPLFRGTRGLKFTREEIEAIRAAEGALGYPPPRRRRAPVAPPIDIAHALVGLAGAIHQGPGTIARWLLAILLAGIAFVFIAGVTGVFSNLPRYGSRSPTRSGWRLQR